MATKKKTTESAKKQQESAAPDNGQALRHAAFQQALETFGTALELLQTGEHARAKELFEGLVASHPDEPGLTERARTYAAICARRLDPPTPEPASADECYLHAVIKLNAREPDEALALLERSLTEQPRAPRLLYARASAHALKGNAEAAVADLRQAIAEDPTIRFQAANDPDFEPIREEPAFIDIIEPTPAGA
jgi:tetratricopeptide (TPR) repeat protein